MVRHVLFHLLVLVHTYISNCNTLHGIVRTSTYISTITSALDGCMGTSNRFIIFEVLYFIFRNLNSFTGLKETHHHVKIYSIH